MSHIYMTIFDLYVLTIYYIFLLGSPWWFYGKKQLDANYLCVIMEVGAAEDTAFAVESVAEKLAELVNTVADTENSDSDYFDFDDHLYQNYF